MCHVKDTEMHAIVAAGDPFLAVETEKSTNQQSMRSPRIIWYSVRFGPKWAQTSSPLWFFCFFSFFFDSAECDGGLIYFVGLQYGPYNIL